MFAVIFPFKNVFSFPHVINYLFVFFCSGLIQFFQIFSEFQANPFYATGEVRKSILLMHSESKYLTPWLFETFHPQSYAGKYVPAIGYYIHKNNPSAKVKINFKGVAIGDGLCDPELVICFKALENDLLRVIV